MFFERPKPEWVYHGTCTNALPGIAEHGLLPLVKNTRVLKYRGRAIFFTSRVMSAERFGQVRCFTKGDRHALNLNTLQRQGYTVVLRVNVERLHGKWRKDFLFAFLTISEVWSWMFFGSVPPESIEVLVLDRWVPIKEAVR